MATKLTLYIEDEAVVARAKAYAAQHETSLSRLVTQYLDTLTSVPQEDFFTKLYDELATEGYVPPTDAELVALRDHHLHEKYGLPLPPGHQEPRR
jgi:hypothetical protein